MSEQEATTDYIQLILNEVKKGNDMFTSCTEEGLALNQHALAKLKELDTYEKDQILKAVYARRVVLQHPLSEYLKLIQSLNDPSVPAGEWRVKSGQ